MIPGEIEGQFAFAGLKNQPPGQARPAFVEMFSEFTDGQPGMRVGGCQNLPSAGAGDNDFIFTPGLADDFLEPLRELNGNHGGFR